MTTKTLLHKLIQDTGYLRKVFLAKTLRGLDGQRYGKFQYYSEKDLEGRKYILYMFDGMTIFFTDVLHDPNNYCEVKVSESPYIDEEVAWIIKVCEENSLPYDVIG